MPQKGRDKDNPANTRKLSRDSVVVIFVLLFGLLLFGLLLPAMLYSALKK